MRRNGFTLVELITVMVVLAVLALGASSYIGIGSQMYVDAAQREQLLAQSRFVAERLVRELRNALPNSIKAENDCLEFMPIKAVGLYQSLTADSLTYSWLGAPVAVGDYIVIYAQYPEHVRPGAESRARQVSTLGANTLTFSGGAFNVESPARRFYVYDDTVRYCRLGANLTRNGELMAQQLQADSRFTVAEATLERNALVNLYLNFGPSGSGMFFNYEVHIPNVP